MGSTNGVWLNQTRLLPHKPYALQSGDEVLLGSLRLIVYYHQDQANGNNAEDVILLAETPSAAARHRRVTTAYLSDVIQPYLTALVDLQKALDEFHGLQPREVALNTLSATRVDLPIGVSLTGASQAALLIKNFIVPWRCEHAAELSMFLTGRPLTTEGATPGLGEHRTVVTSILPAEGVNLAARQAAGVRLRAALPGLARKIAEHLGMLLAADQPGLADKLLPSVSVLGCSRLQMVVADQRETKA